MGGQPLTYPKGTILCHFNLIWPNAPHCLVSWGFFAQVGDLPSLFLLLSPEQLCFDPSQTPRPDFHVGAFSSGIFVTRESSPLISTLF